MKKASILLALLLLVSAGVLFAGGDQEATGGKVKVTMFAYMDLTDAVDTANWEILFTSFKSAHPDVELEIEFAYDESYHNKLQAMLVADQLPDLMLLWPGKRTGQVTASGKIKDLRPWIKGHEEEFASIAMAAQGPKGEMWELPEAVTATHVLFTNEKYLKDFGFTFPKTMNDLLVQGDKFNGAGLIPIAMTNKAGWQMQSCFLSALTERAGGMDWYDRVIVGDNASFADPEFVNALTVIDTLTKKNMFSPGINQADYGQALNDFVNEKAVYYMDGGWRATALVGELNDEQKQSVVYKAFPDIPNQKGRSGSTAAVSGTGYGMNAKLEGAKAEAAWKWIWFRSGPVGSAIRQGQGTNIAYKLPVPGNIDIMMKKLIQFVADSPAGYVLDAKLDQEGMGVLQTAVQEMMLGNKTPRQVAEEFEAWVAANDSARK